MEKIIDSQIKILPERKFKKLIKELNKIKYKPEDIIAFKPKKKWWDIFKNIIKLQEKKYGC